MSGLTRQDEDYLEGRMSLEDYYRYLQDQCFLKMLRGVVKDAEHFYATARNYSGTTLQELVRAGKTEEARAWIEAIKKGVFS